MHNTEHALLLDLCRACADYGTEGPRRLDVLSALAAVTASVIGQHGVTAPTDLLDWYVNLLRQSVDNAILARNSLGGEPCERPM